MRSLRILAGTDAQAADPNQLGGKAANLARLARAGADVPPWILIPPPVRDRAVGSVEPTPDHALLDRVAVALDHAGLTDSLLAVRSSAWGEDAASASYAGQFDTVLGVHAGDREALADAIAAVWASASGARVKAYQGRAARSPRMAVIVQELVDAEASGVAFTADPVTGDRSVCVVSAVRGLGEALVSGEETGDTFRVRVGPSPDGGRAPGAAAEVVETRASPQARALVRVAEGTEWVELGAAERSSPSITGAEAVLIAVEARRLSAELGAPQDVEWALVASRRSGREGGPRRLVILQARPITTLTGGERRIWDNSNIVESYAGVTTPLTFSFARAVYEDVYRQFCGVMGVSDALIERHRDVFAHMLGLVRGRVYYNLLSWYRLLSLLPGYAFNRAFMERMMGVREKLSDPPEPQLVAGKWTDLGRLVRMVVRMIGASRGLRRAVPAFHRRLDDALLPLAELDLSSRDPDELLALYRRLEDDLLRHWQPPLVNDFFAMIWFGVLGRLMEKWLPDEPPTLVNDLLAGEGGMISTEPARRVMALAGMVEASPEVADLFDRLDDAELGRLLTAAVEEGDDGEMADRDRFRTDIQAYLRQFGDRCANELKLETVTLSEDPAFLVSTIRSYWRQGATDPAAGRAREAGIRRAAEARVDDRLSGPRRWLFRAVLRQARARIRDRENLRFERTRVFGVVRRIFVGFGHAMVRAGRLDDPRDVFWLTTGEVFGWADGTAVSVELRPIVAARRHEFAAYEAGPPPPDRFDSWGPPAEVRFIAPAASPAAPADDPGGALLGTGCCPGVVRAPVRIVRDPRHAGDLDGRILVAERTDPGWTLLFPSAAGILVERGSLLSHSAIVAREMGIPCVVSVPGLMAALEDGEVVEMDGGTGVVRRGV